MAVCGVISAAPAAEQEKSGVCYNLPGFDLAINYSNTNISPGGDGKESAVLFYRWQKLLEAGQTTMKLIEAIIKPFKLDDVREALTGIGVQGLTVTEARGFGRQKGQKEIYRGAEYEISFLPKIRLEVAVPDELADQAHDIIRSSAATGQSGDGKIFVFDVQKAVRIRTREEDNEAL